MSAQARIPLTFNTGDPARLKADLERQAATLESYHQALTGPQQATVVQRRLQKGTLNGTYCAFGFWTPVALVNASDVLRISLPRKDPRNSGLPTAVLRQTTAGTIKVSAPDALVNGFAMVEIPNAIGFYMLWFDGENYYADGGATWSEG